ncbi:ankyrin repeat protein [Legionella massiliensis]|uniref:Ankyrin repeat protein n=1 Tax=Legionella massiliensis TaxID=1034943 RepID=A0A078KS05_9GAMM|nr:ankyrin repeat domain-containing protein [Legionella massiliensis]CDZ77245.1 ankyrin repeat protein [Legionella massiliensis]CEE12983.1 Ankyrin repeats (3 copies) [Legionella massiliensis]
MNVIQIINNIEQIRQWSQKTDTSRLPENARDKIKERDKVNHAKAKDSLIKLLNVITTSHDADKIMYFKKLVVGYGLGDLLSSNDILPASEMHPNSGRWGIHYNHSLYQKILPLCQLAYLEEKNGIAEDHALKLSLIFNDEKSVNEYLKAISVGTKSRYLVHDACLFDLPAPEECNFEQWKKIANKKSYMANPRFRELLPHIPAIEAIAQRQERKSLNIQAITAKEKELQSVNQKYSKIEQTPIINPTEADKLNRKQELMQLSQEKSRLSIELAELSKGLPLQDASVTILQAFYEAYKADNNAAHKILIDHGISTQNIELFYSLKRHNDDQAIPAILIKGSDLGYPNCYLTKLDTQSDAGAALAACLGKITDCCQYLGGAGTDCAKHGIESPNSGFYVMFQGDENYPNLTDRIIAQSWVWCDRDGNLCLDSIEAVSQVHLSQVSDFYRYLSITLCENHGIRQINTGAQSGITTQIALQDYPTIKLNAIDYIGYSDSISQLLIADASMPYIFLGRVDSGTLQHKITTKTHEYFKGLFSSNTDLKSNVELQKAISYLIFSTQDQESSPLYQLLVDAAGNRTEELIQLIQINRKYVDHLNNNELNLAFALLDQGAYINSINTHGQSLLHATVLSANHKLLEQLTERNINLDIQDTYGNSALINALESLLYTQKSEEGRAIARYLVEKGANVDMKDDYEFTPLIIAVRNNDLDMTRYLIDKGAGIDIYDGYMRTAMFWAANGGYWEVFSELASKNCRTDVVNYINEDNLLMTALRGQNRDIIRHLINTMPVNIHYQNKRGETVLHLMVHHSEFFNMIIASLSADQLFKALSVRNVDGNTVLHYAVSNPKLLQTILQRLPTDKRVELLFLANSDGDTLLMLIAINTYFLEDTLELIPESQRIELISATDNQGNTVLHRASHNPDTLRTILELIPETQRFALVNLCNKNNETVLHLVAANYGSLKGTLEFLTEQQRVDAVNRINNKGLSVLSIASTNLQILKAIYELYPENQRPEGFGGPNEEQVLSEILNAFKQQRQVDYYSYGDESFELNFDVAVNENNTTEANEPATSSTDSSNDELYEKLSIILDNPEFIEPGVKLKSSLYPNLSKLKNALNHKEAFNVIQEIAAKGVAKNKKVKETASPERYSYIDKRISLLTAIMEAHNFEQALENIKEKLPDIDIPYNFVS